MDNEDEQPGVSPETEQEIRDALGQGARSAANDEITSVARLLRRYYVNFRAQGFSRRQATMFTMVVFQKMLFGG